MTQARRILVGGLAVGLLAGQAFVAAQSSRAVELRLRAARYKAEVRGDLMAAIEDYRQIAKGPDRAAAARALLEMALTYQKLGEGDARGLLAEIVEGYADQPDVVAAARERLTAMGGPERPSEPMPRRVLEAAWVDLADISADGRVTVGQERLAWGAWAIVARDVLTGESTMLADTPGQPHVRVSDDGRHVAFDLRTGEERSIRVIGTEPGAAPQQVPAPPQTTMVPLDWFPGGDRILARVERYADPDLERSEGVELAVISLESREMATVRRFESWEAPAFDARVSPDGGSIAFTARSGPASSDRYVYVIDADGLAQRAVVTSAGTRRSPVWTPDGSYLLYVEARAVWSVGVTDSSTPSAPRLLYDNFDGSPLGVTSAGVFHYERSAIETVNRVYVVPRTPSPADQPLTFAGLGVSWSPDGQSLAFWRDAKLVIRQVATGEERSYSHPGIAITPPRWLHDGSGMIVVVSGEGRVTDEDAALYQVDVDSGEFTHVFDLGTSRTRASALAPDDTTMYLGVQSRLFGVLTGIVAVDLATGNERPVVSFPPQAEYPAMFGIALSPGGQTLALAVYTNPYQEVRIFTVGVDGSNYHAVDEPYGTSWTSVRWTPDGDSLVFVGFDDNRNWQLMRMLAGGGLRVLDGLSFDTLTPLLPDLRMSPGTFNNLDVSPDGSRVAVSALTLGQQELWALDYLEYWAR